jgi:hypothetical protein
VKEEKGAIDKLVTAFDEYLEKEDMPGLVITAIFKNEVHRLDGASFMFTIARNPMGGLGLVILKLIGNTGDPEKDYEPLRVIFEDQDGGFCITPLSMLDDLSPRETQELVSMLHGYVFKVEDDSMQFITKEEMAATVLPGNTTIH